MAITRSPPLFAGEGFSFCQFGATEEPKLERLHPESIRQLRDLVKLHGALAIIAAAKQMDASLNSEKARPITEADKLSLKEANKLFEGIDQCGS